VRVGDQRLHRERVVHGLAVPARERRARVDDQPALRVRVAERRDGVARRAERPSDARRSSASGTGAPSRWKTRSSPSAAVSIR
jgi:hypothetical protein